MSAKLSVNRPQQVLRKSTLALHRMNSKPKAHEGFDDLRIFIKQGSEFTKELVNTLNERAELEMNYSRGLQKLSGKLFKASKDMSGTVSNAWHFIAEDMEATADTHKSMANLLVEECVKPLKMFVDTQHKTRKSLEALVERRSKNLNEWRAAEAKTRLKCYANCKENERVQDQVLDCKLGRGRVLSDKELLKLDAKRRKSEEAVKKSELDYYACNIKAERARLEWESGVLRGCSVFRQMEEDRLDQLKNLAVQYQGAMSDHRPKLVASAKRLHEPIHKCDVERDMDAVNKKTEVDPDSMGEQLLPCFYAEDTTNAMNQERRRESLSKFLRVIKSDIEREKKGKAGVENLAKALQETPKFGSEDSQQDVQEKLQHMKSMLTFLEACRFKVLNGLLTVEGRPRVSHPLSSYIESSKDKAGGLKTVLKVPYWSRQEPLPPVDDMHLGSTGSGSSPASSTPSSLELAKPIATIRGRGDGAGYMDDHFATAALEGIPYISRGTADGAGGSGGDNEDDDDDEDSDFDDFSDEGNEHVNIIEVVNRPPSPQIVHKVSPKAAAKTPSTVAPMQVSSAASSASSSGEPDLENVPEAEPVNENEEVSKSQPEEVLVTNSHVVVSNRSSGNDNSQENEISEIYYQEKTAVPSIGHCTAIYDYVANMYDELTIRVGDQINIHDKQADGWWLGELNGTIGIFPATYVEEKGA